MATCPELTVTSVIRRFYPEYSRNRRLRAEVLRAASCVLECGTAALGAYVNRCECGHIEKVCYNSCRHRSCPACSGGQRAKWLERISADLLPCDHVHVIFTVPDLLNIYWQFNRLEFANALMSAARESLAELLADPRYLGAQPGIISALHTWGRNLSIHPHVHCLVTAGGLTESGEFVRQQRETLLPARVLMIVFRAKLIAKLKCGIAAGRLVVPPSTSASRSQSLLNRLGRRLWNVRIQERYRHGVSVAGYLARYVVGGPIADRRIVAVDDGGVVFRYLDHRTGVEKKLRLSGEDFLTRLFEHVPARSQRTIRHSGLYANCHASTRKQIRQNTPGSESAAGTEVGTAVVAALEPERCPLCNTVVSTLVLYRPVRIRQSDSTCPRPVPVNQPP